MRRKKSTLEDCFQQFINRDYRASVRSAHTLGGNSGWTATLMQIFLISLFRLGESKVAQEAGDKLLNLTAEMPWEHDLIALTLGRAGGEIITKSSGPVQRCQALYYAAVH